MQRCDKCAYWQQLYGDKGECEGLELLDIEPETDDRVIITPADFYCANFAQRAFALVKVDVKKPS